MGAFVDMTGQRFARLLVLGPAGRDKNKRTLWRVLCDCGTEKLVDGAHMRYGRIRSCGCLQAEMAPDHARRTITRFGGYNRLDDKLEKARRRYPSRPKAPLYAVWSAMRQRCSNPRNKDYRHYGGRGITVCDRWAVFENFLADMGERPGPGYSIDRVDNDQGYFPENCRWATQSEQVRNSRRWK